MPAIQICICADGSLPDEEIRELADLGMHSHVDHVVLDGTLVDQAALMGVLERLRRAGLRIRDVTPNPTRPDGLAVAQVAQVSIVGEVGELLQALLGEAVVTEEPATTTAHVRVTSTDDLFDLLHRLGALGLDLRAVHVGGPTEVLPGEGYSPGGHAHVR